MRRKETTATTWLGAMAGLAVIAFLAYSPRARYQATALAQRLVETANDRIKDIRAMLQPKFGHQMAVLEEVSQTLDAATTQFQSSMVVSKVGSALASDPRLQDREIGVRMIGGILHLEGDVRTEEEKVLASEVARRASGAELVANDLRVGLTAG